MNSLEANLLNPPVDIHQKYIKISNDSWFVLGRMLLSLEFAHSPDGFRHNPLVVPGGRGQRNVEGAVETGGAGARDTWIPPPKTNMTSWKIHHEWRCISYWKRGFSYVMLVFSDVSIHFLSILRSLNGKWWKLQLYLLQTGSCHGIRPITGGIKTKIKRLGRV